MGWPAHSTARSSRKSKGSVDGAPLQFVHDGAIVDALHGRREAIAFVEETIALLAQRPHVDRAHAEEALGDEEIAQRLLAGGLDFEQDHVGRIVVAHDSAAQQAVILVHVQTARLRVERGVDAVSVAIAFGHHRLIRIERREALNFDQLRL